MKVKLTRLGEREGEGDWEGVEDAEVAIVKKGGDLGGG